MYNANTPPESELPSSRALLTSTLIALAVAAVLLTTVVLPAEYGVDPTGLGRILGLKEMGEIKMALAQEAAADAAGDTAVTQAAITESPATSSTPAANTPAATGALLNSHVTEVELKPGEGKEIKLAMREGASVKYQWTVAGGVVNSDTHADRPGTPYHGYMKGNGQASDEGMLVAAFDGKHGWFWRNRGKSDVTVTLRTDGDYQDLAEVK